MIYSGRINSFMHCIYKPGYMIVNNVLGRDYIFVNRFNSCNHTSFHLQVVHGGVAAISFRCRPADYLRAS